MFCRWKKRRNTIWPLSCYAVFFAARRIMQIAIIGAMILLIAGCNTCQISADNKASRDDIKQAAKKIYAKSAKKKTVEEIKTEINNQLDTQGRIVREHENAYMLVAKKYNSLSSAQQQDIKTRSELMSSLYWYIAQLNRYRIMQFNLKKK